jgi:protein SCO1/2
MKIRSLLCRCMSTLLLAMTFANTVVAGSSVQQPSSAKVLSDESIFQLESSWVDQSGKKIVLKELRGKPSVLAMVYMTCQGACPIITSDMQRIEKVLPPEKREQSQFVLISLDPERDTQKALNKFAESHGLDLRRWRLLAGSTGAVRELAAVLGVKYKRDASGNFSHSNIITILDSEGVIRHQQIGLRQDPQASTGSVLKSIEKN